MDINEIIEDWDKDRIPASPRLLNEMQATVTGAKEHAADMVNKSENRETREMYYHYHVLMVEISQAIRMKIDFLKIKN